MEGGAPTLATVEAEDDHQDLLHVSQGQQQQQQRQKEAYQALKKKFKALK